MGLKLEASLGTRLAVAFARVLRGAGVVVPVGATIEYTRALGVVGLERELPVYWAGRATFVLREEDLAVYDRCFAAFWEEHAKLGVPDVYGGSEELTEVEGGSDRRCSPTSPDIDDASSVSPDEDDASSVSLDVDDASSVSLDVDDASSVSLDEDDASSVSIDEDDASSVSLDEDDASSVSLDVDDASSEESGSGYQLSYSPSELLRKKDLAKCTPQELEEVYRLLHGTELVPPERLSRRKGALGPLRSQLDLRSTLRRSIQTDGEMLRLTGRARGSHPRRLVVICDVSGSMTGYSSVLLRFAHVAVAGPARAEAFALGTRLTRLTSYLALRDLGSALSEASAAIPDMAGGTRLGEGLRLFNDGFGIRGMARGAVVVILSDGWDRGDPDVLAAEMGRLARVAFEVIWVNPLKATPGYEPLARGMAAALPFVDHFVDGNSVASLEELAYLVADSRRRGDHRVSSRRALGH